MFHCTRSFFITKLDVGRKNTHAHTQHMCLSTVKVTVFLQVLAFNSSFNLSP